MKIASTIVASLLGLIFIVFGLNGFFDFMSIKPDPFPEGSTAPDFWKAMGTSGYIKVVKVVEILGGLALLIPRFRRLGIILIAAVVFNIATYQVVFYQSWASLLDPVLIFAIVATLFLVRSHSLCSCLMGCGTCNREGTGCCNCGPSCCTPSSNDNACSVPQPPDKKGGCGCS
jgi:uncharacterized membrane protein YphA (DoxX/SURF4 family)